MFKQFFELFRKDNLLQQAYDRSLEMLEADREMFLAASSSLREHDDARIEIDIYAKDQLINAYEREVRRKVLTHLALTSSQSIAAGLALVSIVIDIERIGDLTKNIVDLALRHPGKLDCGSLEPDVRKIETTVKTMFTLLIEALPERRRGQGQRGDVGALVDRPQCRRDPQFPDRPRGPRPGVQRGCKQRRSTFDF